MISNWVEGQLTSPSNNEGFSAYPNGGVNRPRIILKFNGLAGYNPQFTHDTNFSKSLAHIQNLPKMYDTYDEVYQLGIRE